MKNRKQKPTQSKKPIQNLDQTTYNHFSIANTKQLSGHTKVSTNCTIHSSVPTHSNTDKKGRAKKIISPAVKQNSVEMKKGQLSSKTNRKWKALDIPLNVENASKWIQQASYREYCVVDQNFIPISPRNEQKLFEDFFSQTASTSYDFNYFNHLPKNKGFQDQKSQLRKRSVSSRKQREQREQSIKEVKVNVQKEDKAVSNLYENKVYASAEIDAVAQVCEIGMQYSERKEFIEQKIVQVPQKKEVIQQKQQPAITNAQQSLSDILFKLQFTHLMDDKSFNALSPSEKEHFSQLLQSVMSKLTPKQKQPAPKPKMKPIIFDQIKQNQQEAEPQVYQKPSNQYPFQLSTPPITVNFDKLEQLITRRQLLQKNVIQDQTRHVNTVDTSLISILNFLGHFFCFIELQYTEDFVIMIRKMYGFNFREKYRRITRNLPLNQDKKFRVVDEGLFLDFINESDLNMTNNCEIVHLKAIFDAFNQHLEEYRPYYTGNGEQFPWAFKLFTTMSEYSIDEDSLQIIFRQAKDKILQWAQNLCGLLVQYDQPLPPKNPLQQKKTEKETILVNTWINEQNFQKDGIQLFSTQALHQLSQDIFNQLIGQLAKDAAFLFI